MPGGDIDAANPAPPASQIPDDVLNLVVKLDKIKLDGEDAKSIAEFWQACNYIAAAMIFLSDNVLIERDITFDDIKPRLLGHWGTCPGLALVYAHTSYLIKKHDLDMLYVVGPGHGAPAILAGLWLEGTMEKFYPKYTRDLKGLSHLIKWFSTPAGFPSHISAETPGSIHEGGELGYALSVAFGSIMDKPEQITVVVVGDGESETGPTATAWHGYKYIDPKESGAIIPILHVNGFKISERTIPGVMDDKELVTLYTGYGYQVKFVEDLDDIHGDMASAMDWAVKEIKRIQGAARSDNPIMKPRWPMLILRTPKGWGGPKVVDGKPVEGNYRAHQVPLMKAKKDPGQLKQLQEWLTSYKPKDLFTTDGHIKPLVTRILTDNPDKLLGQRKETYAGYRPLDMEDWKKWGVKKGDEASCMLTIGEFLDDIFVKNPKDIRLFSPDELESNKLSAVFKHTNRNFQWDQFSNARGGRVIEMLSEHTLQGFLQGYTLTGRTGIFPSYESFLGIVGTMMVQYAKFSKMGQETSWRQPIASLNYIETSTWTRQEHNGFSHQNPSFISLVLNLKPQAARVYLPPDANTFLSTISHCLRSKNYVNLMIGSKQPSPVFLSPEEADAHCRAGASVWKFASTDDGLNPDVVLVGIGVEITFEVIAAAALLRKIAPQLRVRIVNVTDLMILQNAGGHPHALTDDDFNSLFTSDRPIHFNFHGYPSELKGLLFGRPHLERVSIEAYAEEGSTTTPFDMMLRNRVSRYHVAESAIRGGAKHNEKVRLQQHELISNLKHSIEKDKEFIMANGIDPETTYDVPRFDGGEAQHRDVGYAD